MIKNIFQSLSEAKTDPAVGIAIANVLEDSDSSCYITEIQPGKCVNPHYHQHSAEIYLILSGEGLMHIAQANHPQQKQTHHVKAGDIFKIEANTIHKLENPGNISLRLLFMCNPNHLSDDRVMADL